jgi:hypothetical protein
MAANSKYFGRSRGLRASTACTDDIEAPPGSVIPDRRDNDDGFL